MEANGVTWLNERELQILWLDARRWPLSVLERSTEELDLGVRSWNVIRGRIDDMPLKTVGDLVNAPLRHYRLGFRRNCGRVSMNEIARAMCKLHGQYAHAQAEGVSPLIASLSWGDL